MVMFIRATLYVVKRFAIENNKSFLLKKSR
jgi:hypothetical protein